MSSEVEPTPHTQPHAAWKNYLDRTAAGDHSALAQLYDESSPLVHSVALRVLGDPAEAEEVTLDVYVHVWRTAATYDSGRGTVTAWLVTLARSRAVDRMRSRAGRHKREQLIFQFHEMCADLASPETEAELAQRRSRILAALDTLSPQQREAIELAFFSGLTHSELADRLGQPLGTVKNRIRLGMMKLREQLDAHALSTTPP
jgi:RNA polymerase sigma-70 factor, ECF subfamily